MITRWPFQLSRGSDARSRSRTEVLHVQHVPLPGGCATQVEARSSTDGACVPLERGAVGHGEFRLVDDESFVDGYVAAMQPVPAIARAATEHEDLIALDGHARRAGHGVLPQVKVSTGVYFEERERGIVGGPRERVGPPS
jgi:hypothetical protein